DRLQANSVALVLAVLLRIAAQPTFVGIARLAWIRLPRVLLVARLLLGVSGRLAGFRLWIAPRHGRYLPSSNTTSRLAVGVVWPGGTGGAPAARSIAIAFIIGSGGWSPPPSLMLTMRRTVRPSDLAYICARACAFFSAAWRASS